MIALLRGRLVEKGPNRVIVDVQGVGYEVHVPLSTYYHLGEDGAEVSLRVHTHVREDALQLYGFLTERERQLFERLIGVSGIGPRLAVSVLSGMDTADLVAAVQAGDVGRLTRMPGVGRKTAERIVLELKDRLAPLAAPVPESGDTGSRLRIDVVSALQNLGYHRPQAEKVVDAIMAAAPEASFEEALRSALRELAR